MRLVLAHSHRIKVMSGAHGTLNPALYSRALHPGTACLAMLCMTHLASTAPNTWQHTGSCCTNHEFAGTSATSTPHSHRIKVMSGAHGTLNPALYSRALHPGTACLAMLCMTHLASTAPNTWQHTGSCCTNHEFAGTSATSTPQKIGTAQACHKLEQSQNRGLGVLCTGAVKHAAAAGQRGSALQ